MPTLEYIKSVFNLLWQSWKYFRNGENLNIAEYVPIISTWTAIYKDGKLNLSDHCASKKPMNVRLVNQSVNRAVQIGKNGLYYTIMPGEDKNGGVDMWGSDSHYYLCDTLDVKFVDCPLNEDAAENKLLVIIWSPTK